MATYKKQNKSVTIYTCFKSILINHKITHDTVMKKHLRPRCIPFQREGGTLTLSCPRSPVFLAKTAPT